MKSCTHSCCTGNSDSLQKLQSLPPLQIPTQILLQPLTAQKKEEIGGTQTKKKKEKLYTTRKAGE